MIFLQELKKYTTGFTCISKIEDYTGASHRIFVYTIFGNTTLFWYETQEILVCKNQKLFDKLQVVMKDKIQKGLIKNVE